MDQPVQDVQQQCYEDIMNKKYDNTMSGAVFVSKDKDVAIRQALIEQGIYSGVFQITKKEKSKRQCYARIKGKNKNVAVIDKDGVTVLFQSKLVKNKERGENGPHYYFEFGETKIAAFKKKRANGDVYYQFVPATVGADVGERPVDVTTIV